MKKFPNLLLTFFLIFMLAVPQGALAATPEVLALVNVLVSKNVITSAEADEVIREAERVVAEQKAEITSEVQEVSGLPDWVSRTTFKGDLRLRYQYESRDGSKGRNRERYRLRWGFETYITDTLKVGARFATGGTGTTSARSTNQSADTAFGTKSFDLDKAYFEWKPYDNLRLIGGKFNNKALFVPDDLLWDGDITWEGQAINFDYDLDEDNSLFLNTGLFVIEENLAGFEPSHDPLMFVAQPGFKSDLGGVKLTSGLAFYYFSHIDNNVPVTGGGGSNALIQGGLVEESFNVINPNVELVYDWEGDDGQKYRGKLIGDMVFNPDPNDYGFLFGAKIGHKKVKEFGQWQAGYNYRYLERNAFIDAFPDSDSYGGVTNIKGHELTFKYGLTKNTYFGLDYYHMGLISSTGKNPENLLQADVVYKF